MDYETLRYERTDHVVTLSYDRPDQHNAVNWQMNAELHDAWQRFRDDEDSFVLVITGAGEQSFCAGWYLQDAVELTQLGDFDAFRVSLYNEAGACGLYAQGGHLQAGDRSGQRLCLRRWLGDGAARRRP